jgi:hypothetical protein
LKETIATDETTTIQTVDNDSGLENERTW